MPNLPHLQLPKQNKADIITTKSKSTRYSRQTDGSPCTRTTSWRPPGGPTPSGRTSPSSITRDWPNPQICQFSCCCTADATRTKSAVKIIWKLPNSRIRPSPVDHQYWRPCPNSERGTIVDDGLAEANLDFTGAMAILNIGSWETYVSINVARMCFIFT